MASLFLPLVAFVAAASALDPAARITATGCGQAPARSNISSKIVGGTESTPYDWPFICSLTTSGQHICGGSLVKALDGTYVFVTAAHCVDRNARFYEIYCSIHWRQQPNTNDPYRKRFEVSSYVNHESYNPNTFSNDISVMYLTTQPEENPYLQPVCIADVDYFDGEMSTVIGWGTLFAGGSAATRLREVSKPILSNAKCSQAYGSAFIASTMMCSGIYEVGGKDACQGDSGGPLVVMRNNAWTLAGVVSWGYGCAEPNYPGIYADVFQLRSWLNSKING